MQGFCLPRSSHGISGHYIGGSWRLCVHGGVLRAPRARFGIPGSGDAARTQGCTVGWMTAAHCHGVYCTHTHRCATCVASYLRHAAWHAVRVVTSLGHGPGVGEQRGCHAAVECTVQCSGQSCDRMMLSDQTAASQCLLVHKAAPPLLGDQSSGQGRWAPSRWCLCRWASRHAGQRSQVQRVVGGRCARLS